MNKKMLGRIIRISKAGWGYISSKEVPFIKIFFHWTELRQDTTPFLDLRPGMVVEFTPVQLLDKRWRAIHIRVLDKEEYEQRQADLPALQERRPDITGEDILEEDTPSHD